ncbi:MAG: hypothetical protein AAB518_02415 [Patescibacteria group bacterium]
MTEGHGEPNLAANNTKAGNKPGNGESHIDPDHVLLAVSAAQLQAESTRASATAAAMTRVTAENRLLRGKLVEFEERYEEISATSKQLMERNATLTEERDKLRGMTERLAKSEADLQKQVRDLEGYLKEGGQKLRAARDAAAGHLARCMELQSELAGIREVLGKLAASESSTPTSTPVPV